MTVRVPSQDFRVASKCAVSHPPSHRSTGGKPKSFKRKVSKTKPKAPPPLTIRLTHAERAQLERDTGALSMAAYARLKLFADSDLPKRRKPSRKKHLPSSELAVIGALLAELGKSDLATSLKGISAAAQTGALPVTDELEAELLSACVAIRDMRSRLIGALGIKAR